jgi:hypothetical protein
MLDRGSNRDSGSLLCLFPGGGLGRGDPFAMRRDYY